MVIAMSLFDAAFPASASARRSAVAALRGTAEAPVYYSFSFPVARWLARRCPGEVTIDWDEFEDTTRFDELLARILHPAEDERILYGTEIATMLDRHGVRVEVVDELCRNADVGERLHAYAEENGGDMLVIGAYGHSRLREIILGGATRHMCTHAQLPILMAH